MVAGMIACIGPVTIKFNLTQSEALREGITGAPSRPHLHDLGLGRHDKRAVLHDGLLEWSARKEHKREAAATVRPDRHVAGGAEAEHLALLCHDGARAEAARALVHVPVFHRPSV